jgi:tetratricopeptide (TPR) repeat protein
MAQDHVFNSKEFWSKYPANNEAEQAWRNGVKWTSPSSDGFESIIAYDNNNIFGFMYKKLPTESDLNVKNMERRGYIARTEMKLIHATGLFAFNNFDCSAKSNINTIFPNIKYCNSININSKLSSEWKNVAFSIIKLSSDEICSCRKALEIDSSSDNYNIFFGPIARHEINELYENNQKDDLINFFIKHHKKNIFDKNQFLMVIEFLIQEKRNDDAKVLLDVTISKFANTLNLSNWETCGDYYLALNDKEKAIEAFNKASDLLNAIK